MGLLITKKRRRRMLFPFGDESDEDDAGSRFTIHDLCESGENVERLRKKLTFKKAETHAKDAGELDDENDEKEEGGDDLSDDGKDFDPDAEEEEEEEEEENGDDDEENRNDGGNDDDDCNDAEEQFNTNLKHEMNRRDDDGQTALHCAILSGQNIMVE